jgi:uncharacterized protein YebE (UPF0316 family)
MVSGNPTEESRDDHRRDQLPGPCSTQRRRSANNQATAMSLSNAAGTVTIVLLAATTVTLWTARVALAASGRKLASATIAAVEAVTFVIAFRQIASNLAAVDKVAGYAIGVAAGTLLGLYASERLSTGQSAIQIIVRGHRPELGRAMHQLGWPATEHQGSGPQGPVTTLLLVVDDTRLAAVLEDTRRLAPDGFVSVHQLRRVLPTPLPLHLHQAGSRRRPFANRQGLAASRRQIPELA